MESHPCEQMKSCLKFPSSSVSGSRWTEKGSLTGDKVGRRPVPVGCTFKPTGASPAGKAVIKRHRETTDLEALKMDLNNWRVGRIASES